MPVPRWLPHKEVLRMVKESVAAIEWSGAILNIINMDQINPQKVAPVKQDEGRKHSSFAIRRAEARQNGRNNSHKKPRKFESNTHWPNSKGGFGSRWWNSRGKSNKSPYSSR